MLLVLKITQTQAGKLILAFLHSLTFYSFVSSYDKAVHPAIIQGKQTKGKKRELARATNKMQQ